MLKVCIQHKIGYICAFDILLLLRVGMGGNENEFTGIARIHKFREWEWLGANGSWNTDKKA